MTLSASGLSKLKPSSKNSFSLSSSDNTLPMLNIFVHSRTLTIRSSSVLFVRLFVRWFVDGFRSTRRQAFFFPQWRVETHGFGYFRNLLCRGAPHEINYFHTKPTYFYVHTNQPSRFQVSGGGGDIYVFVGVTFYEPMYTPGSRFVSLEKDKLPCCVTGSSPEKI
jgi:hypothetical protein